MEELIQQIEALVCSSRLHDGRVEFALYGKTGRLYFDATLMGLVARNDCPAYTYRIDDALTLVPNGWTTLISIGNVTMVELTDCTQGAEVAPQTVEATAATPALAITAAALRARLAVDLK